MAEATRGKVGEQERIMLGLLDLVARDSTTSQRRLAAELGIALGLVNAYLKRCVKKGLVKAKEAPARRYVYYLTPRGLAEKSRLTIGYLSYSFEFFRRAKRDCVVVFRTARTHGYRRVVLAGASDLAEIAAICALESDIVITAVVDEKAVRDRFVGLPLVRSFRDLAVEPEAVVLTDLLMAQSTCERLIARFGRDRILIPELLQLRVSDLQEQGP